MRLHRSVFVFYGIAAIAVAAVASQPKLGMGPTAPENRNGVMPGTDAAPEAAGEPSGTVSQREAIAQVERALPPGVDLHGVNPINNAPSAAAANPPPVELPSSEQSAQDVQASGYTTVSFEPGRPMVNPTGLPLR